MLQQACDFFSRFYLTILKEHISDPVIHSQWNYFLSMFKTNTLEKERIQLYLSILNSQKNKHKQTNKYSTAFTEPLKSRPQSKIQLVTSHENQFDLHDIKLEKRYSENWKINMTTNQCKATKEIIKLTPQPLSLKKKTSEQESSKNNRSIENQSKTIWAKTDSIYSTPFTPYAYLRPQSPKVNPTQTRQSKLKQRNKKLCQISNRLVNAFEGSRLRG